MPRKQKPNSDQPSKWDLSVVERWCLYATQTGFQPMGPHRRLLDTLFFRHWDKCEHCGGIGIVNATEPQHKKGWVNCSICQGLGGSYTGSESDWNQFIIKIMTHYPKYVCGHTKEEYWSIYLNHLTN